MPVIENPHDVAALRHARSSQDDPWVIHLIVRKGHHRTLGGLLRAGAEALAGGLGRFAVERPERFEAWRSGSYRKVTLSARGAQWERLGELIEEGLAGYEHDGVLVIEPLRRSQRPTLLDKLQARIAGLDAPRAEGQEGGRRLPLVINGDLGMSTGKTLAQVAHAVQIAFDLLCVDRDLPVEVFIVDDRRFREIAEQADAAAVRDAGLTETAPGSVTVLAITPRARADDPPALATAEPLA